MRKALRIIGIILLLVSIPIGTVALLLRSGRIQTAVIQRLTEELSKNLDADIHIDRVKFRFFNSLRLEGV